MKTFFLLFLSFLSFELFAQVQPKFSEKLNKKYKFIQFNGAFGDKVVFNHANSIKASRTKLGVFDQNTFQVLKDEVSLLISGNSIDDEIDFARSYVVKNGIVAIGTAYNSRKNVRDFYIKKLGTTLEIEKDWNKVHSIEGKAARNSSWRMLNQPGSDELPLVIELEARNETEQRIQVIFLGIDGSKISNQEITLPYSPRNLDVERVFRFPNQKIALVAEYRGRNKSENKDQDQSTNDNLLTFEFDPKDGSISEHRIKTEDYRVMGNYPVANGNNLDLITLLTKKSKFTGIGTSSLNTDSKVMSPLNASLFNKEMIGQLEEASRTRLAKRGKESLSSKFYIFKVLNNPKTNENYVICQYYYSYQQCTTTSGGVTTCRTYYVYKDILVIATNQKGEINWVNLIPHNFTTNVFLTQGDLGIPFIKGGELNFFFDKEVLDPNKKSKRNNVGPVLLTVNGSGTPKRNAIDLSNKSRVYISDASGVLVNQSLYLIGIEKRNKLFIRLDL
jgi:hypothetical protein